MSKGYNSRNDDWDRAEQRHDKLNFKKYITTAKAIADDEFSDVPFCTIFETKISEDSYKIYFNEIDYVVNLPEEAVSKIKAIRYDTTIDITDNKNNSWYVTRTINDELVLETDHLELSAKLSFSDFNKKVK